MKETLFWCETIMRSAKVFGCQVTRLFNITSLYLIRQYYYISYIYVDVKRDPSPRPPFSTGTSHS